MIPGSLNSKITERQPKTTERRNISLNEQNYKKLPEKTPFALRSKSDNGKSSNPIDKKTLNSFPQNEFHIKAGVKNGPAGSGQVNDAANSGRGPGPPLRLVCDGRRTIKPSTTSVPTIASISTMTRSSSVTHSKGPPTKKPIKHAEWKKVSNDTKKGDASPKTECAPTPTEITSKIPVNSNNPNLLKKSTCPPCVKLKQGVNSFHPKRTLAWNPPIPPARNVPRPVEKARSLSRELAERRTVKFGEFTSEERPHAPPKLTEVKRMKSEGDSIATRNTRTSTTTAPPPPRPATSETKNFDTNIKCPKISARKEPSTFFKPTENMVNTGYNSHVLHVLSPDFAVTGLKIKDEREKSDTDADESPKRAKNTDHQLNFPSFSSLRPIQDYDSFDSIDRKIHADETLSENVRISNDWDWGVREACDEADFLHGSDDDFGDTFSDIIRQLYSLNGEQYRPNTDTSATADKTRSERTTKSQSLDSNADQRLSQTGANRENEDSRNNIHPPPADTTHTDTKTIVSDSRKGKSKEAEEGESTKFAQMKERNSEAGASCVPSEFFQTHKNLGFIGKEEDEERVSFDPALVTLYQPRETQMLLYDLANCIATQAYLRMCGINYVLAERKNAEHMSPSGKVPFVSSCLCIIPEFEGIVSFMQYKKYSCSRIRECDKAAFRETISMIVDTLEVAERYICWHDAETVVTYTKPRIGGLFPFPLNHVIYWKKRYEERKRLALEETKEPSFDEVLKKINCCFNTLSQLLGNKSFFFGDCCTEIDALVYGHIYAAFTIQQEGVFRHLQFIIKKFPNLLIFACNFDKMFALCKFSSINLSPLA